MINKFSSKFILVTFEIIFPIIILYLFWIEETKYKYVWVRLKKIFRRNSITAVPVYRSVPLVSDVLEFYDVITVDDILSNYLFPSLGSGEGFERFAFDFPKEQERMSHLPKYYIVLCIIILFELIQNKSTDPCYSRIRKAKAFN